jgi:hypothetical protein
MNSNININRGRKTTLTTLNLTTRSSISRNNRHSSLSRNNRGRRRRNQELLNNNINLQQNSVSWINNIENLPRQTSENTIIDQFFNGTPFQ